MYVYALTLLCVCECLYGCMRLRLCLRRCACAYKKRGKIDRIKKETNTKWKAKFIRPVKKKSDNEYVNRSVKIDVHQTPRLLMMQKEMVTAGEFQECILDVRTL